MSLNQVAVAIKERYTEGEAEFRWKEETLKNGWEMEAEDHEECGEGASQT